MSDNRRQQEAGRRNSRLRRLSDSTAKLMRQLRLIRSDSGYGSDDQLERRDSADSGADVAAERTGENSQQSLPRLVSHAELEEEDSAVTDEEEEEGFTDERAAGATESRPLSHSERHLISVRFALLEEQSRTYCALRLADMLEEEELERQQRQEETTRLREELDLRQKDVDLFKVGRRRRKSYSLSAAGSADVEYFESGLTRRQLRLQKNDWRKQWSLRTSNWMYDGYWNRLDYWY